MTCQTVRRSRVDNLGGSGYDWILGHCQGDPIMADMHDPYNKWFGLHPTHL